MNWRFVGYLDLGERDSLTSSTSEEDNTKTMKTSEEAVDFEKEFRPDDVGKEYRTQLLIVSKSNLIIICTIPTTHI